MTASRCSSPSDALRNGRLHLVPLAHVAHLRDPRDPDVLRPHARPGQEGASLGFHLAEEGVDQAPVRGVEALARGADEVEGERRRQEPVRRHGPRPERQEDARHLEDAGDLPAVHGAGPAEGEERIAAQILSALDAVNARGRRHVLVDHAVDSPRRRDDVEPERSRHLLLDGPPGGVPVEPHAAPEKEIGVDVAEDEIGVGHRGQPAAEVVAGGTRIGPRAVGTDFQEAEAIHARDGAAPRADLDHLDDGNAHGQAGALLEAIRARDLELAGHQRHAAVDHAGLGRGAPHVEGEHAQLAPLAGGQRGGEGAGGGTGLHEANGKLARRRRQRDAAGRLHDVELSGNALLGQARLEIGEVARHERSHVDVGRGGRGPLVLADLGHDVGRARDGQARRHLADQLDQAPLVDGIDVGVQQADGQRLDAIGEQPSDHLARGRFVERSQDAAVGEQPLGDLTPQVARAPAAAGAR